MKKVLVANRGAIARRIIRACNEAHIASVAVYSDADAGAMYLAEASEAWALSGVRAEDTYLNQPAVLKIMRDSGADAVHPGYGFLSENAGFARAVVDAGGLFIGPAAEAIEQMGDKVAARTWIEERGFPVFPGSNRIEDERDALTAARKIGYPILVKPSGGGGGLGMGVARDADELLQAIARARAIAENAFADSGVYLERYIERPRHIEYQVIGDKRGRVMHLYERECSVQRRNQKLIEESPAPNIARETLATWAQRTAEVCQQLGYGSLGTVETLMGRDGEIGFLEMNTRIQVEHGVTEAITGIDLVRTQLEIAQGGNLPELPQPSGHAIEARIYAEDSRTLLPSTGRLTDFDVPDLFGVRVETGFARGQTVTPYYDALLAKVIAHGHTRELAIGRLNVALRAFEISGVQTNQALLRRVLEDAAFLAGDVDTGIVDRILTE